MVITLFKRNSDMQQQDFIQSIFKITSWISGCWSIMIVLLIIFCACIALMTPMMAMDKVISTVSDTVNDVVDTADEAFERFKNFVSGHGLTTDEESFHKELRDEYESYKEKGIIIDTRLIQSIVFYDSGIDENEDYSCDLPENASEEDFSSCVPSQEGYDYGQLRDEVHDLVKGMVDENSLKSEEDFNEWLKDNFIEDKLESLDYDIPDNDVDKERSFDEFIEIAYQKKGLYEELLGEDEAELQCEFNGIQSSTTLNVSQLQGLSRKQCVELLGPIVKGDYANTKIFASITLAQAIEESGCGTSPIAKKASNLFGMKAYGSKNDYWNGDYYSSSSGDWRKYTSVNNSIYDHSRNLVNGSTYKREKVVEQKTPEKQIYAMQRAGYCYNCPGYEERILGYIKTYNLEKWDIAEGTNDCISGSLQMVPGSYHKPIIYYNQGDYEAYRYGSYGTIKSHGCGPSSMAIIVSSMLGKKHDPVEVTNWACSHGLCTSNGSSHSMAKEIGEHYGLKVSGEISQDKAGQQQVINALSSGKSMIVTLQGPGIFTSGGHFLVLVGITQDNRIQVADPGSRNRTKQTFSMAEITRSQKKWWIVTEP